MKKPVITIDGPACSGKGTLARLLAQELGFFHLDSGLLYRAAAWLALEAKADLESSTSVMQSLGDLVARLTPEVLANPELRSERISEAASFVSAIPQLREALLDFQRAFAKNPPQGCAGAVIEGRDIGTIVCPDADLKIFITAAPEARAERRVKDLEKQGVKADMASVLESIKARDLRDSTRAAAPLKPAEGAHILDNTTLNAQETLEKALTLVRAGLIQSPAKS